MVNERFRIGSMELVSRIVMPPMATAKSTADGRVTEDLLAYYRARAKSGRLGMIITEHSYVSLEGKAKAGQLSVSRDEDVEGLAALAAAIQAYGTRAVAQINHSGAAALREVTGLPAVSASAVGLPEELHMGDPVAPEELSAEGIARITREFAEAAGRVKRAGFDGVEIHCAHAYLLNQFYSPITNRRTDAYGGSLENRLRFLQEVVAAVRETVGEDYPVAVRLGGCDYMDGGNTVEDCVEASRMLEAAGVDLIDLSGGMCRYVLPGHTEAGYFAEMSAAVKAAVSVPVLVTGGVKKAAEAEELLAAGAADLIGVGRALLADADWAEKEMQ